MNATAECGKSRTLTRSNLHFATASKSGVLQRIKIHRVELRWFCRKEHRMLNETHFQFPELFQQYVHGSAPASRRRRRAIGKYSVILLQPFADLQLQYGLRAGRSVSFAMDDTYRLSSFQL